MFKSLKVNIKVTINTELSYLILKEYFADCIRRNCDILNLITKYEVLTALQFFLYAFCISLWVNMLKTQQKYPLTRIWNNVYKIIFFCLMHMIWNYTWKIFHVFWEVYVSICRERYFQFAYNIQWIYFLGIK